MSLAVCCERGCKQKVYAPRGKRCEEHRRRRRADQQSATFVRKRTREALARGEVYPNVCKVCEEEILPGLRRRDFCSDECFKIHDAARGREYRATDPRRTHIARFLILQGRRLQEIAMSNQISVSELAEVRNIGVTLRAVSITTNDRKERVKRRRDRSRVA